MGRFSFHQASKETLRIFRAIVGLACSYFLGASVLPMVFSWDDVTHRCFLGAVCDGK